MSESKVAFISEIESRVTDGVTEILSLPKAYELSVICAFITDGISSIRMIRYFFIVVKISKN